MTSSNDNVNAPPSGEQPASVGHGSLFVVAAPSGAGKTSLVRALIEHHPDTAVAVSHTTRKRRNDEVDGRNYHFISEAYFTQMQQLGAFVESARVFGNLYGTSHAEITRIRSAGQHVILEIDWQGAQQIRAALEGTRSIFILPPSLDTLSTRLRARGQDDEDTIQRRMSEAISEMSHYGEFDYIVVNDQFDRALGHLTRIVEDRGEDLRLERQREGLSALLANLLPLDVP